VSGSGTSSDRGGGGGPDDPEVETVIQPSLEPDDDLAPQPRAARGTSKQPALEPAPSFDDRGDTVEYRPESDLFESRGDMLTQVDPPDEFAAVTIDYRLEDASRDSRSALDPTTIHDALGDEPTSPRDEMIDDAVDELSSYAVIVDDPHHAEPTRFERPTPRGERTQLARPTPREEPNRFARPPQLGEPTAFEQPTLRPSKPAAATEQDSLGLAATVDVRAETEELDHSADELVSALERGLGVVADRRSRSDSAELEIDDDVDSLLGSLERELRATGTLSFATCEALRTDRRLCGLEFCLAFLRVTVFAGESNLQPIGRRRRVQVCRLLLLAIAAHTDSPRWSGFQVEQMFEAALSIPGAELSDLVQALFALLVDSRGTATAAQARFIREVGAHVTGKRRQGHSADDFVWIAVRLADPLFPATEAQAFLAAHVLPRRLRVTVRDTITRCLRASALADEVAHILDHPP
jgi:hypothetical protein